VTEEIAVNPSHVIYGAFVAILLIVGAVAAIWGSTPGLVVALLLGIPFGLAAAFKDRF